MEEGNLSNESSPKPTRRHKLPRQKEMGPALRAVREESQNGTNDSNSFSQYDSISLAGVSNPGSGGISIKESSHWDSSFSSLNLSQSFENMGLLEEESVPENLFPSGQKSGAVFDSSSSMPSLGEISKPSSIAQSLVPPSLSEIDVDESSFASPPYNKSLSDINTIPISDLLREQAAVAGTAMEILAPTLDFKIQEPMRERWSNCGQETDDVVHRVSDKIQDQPPMVVRRSDGEINDLASPTDNGLQVLKRHDYHLSAQYKELENIIEENESDSSLQDLLGNLVLPTDRPIHFGKLMESSLRGPGNFGKVLVDSAPMQAMRFNSIDFDDIELEKTFDATPTMARRLESVDFDASSNFVELEE
jgi:hypothetical protein